MARFLTPFLYATAVPAVCLAIIVVVATIDRTFGLQTWHRVGDFDAALALLLIGAPVFAGLTYVILRLESIVYPMVITHFRHCIFLYVGGVAMGAILWSYRSMHGGLGYAYVVALFATATFAIVTNAITLFVLRRRGGRTAIEAATADN